MRLAAVISASVLVLSGAAHASDCAKATAKLGGFLAAEGHLAASKFQALDEGEKWYLSASRLVAQAERLDAMMAKGASADRRFVSREKQVYRILDEAEPCYRGQKADPYQKFVSLPTDDARAQMRARLEAYP